MANIYTSKILTPALNEFHDIEGISSIQKWIESGIPIEERLPSDLLYRYPFQGVDYPFYYKRTLETFRNFQYGFAPNCVMQMYTAGTEFFDTTAHWEIFDEFRPGDTTVIDKFIPGLITTIEYPPSGSHISTVSATDDGCAAAFWYVTVSRHDAATQRIKTASHLVYGFATTLDINPAEYTALNLDASNLVPEAILVVDTDIVNNTLFLTYQFEPATTTVDATYNFVAQSIKLPITQTIDSSSYYTCQLSDSDILYTIPYSDNVIGGKAYTFIHNGYEGVMVETSIANYAGVLTQNSNITKSPSAPDINVVATTSGELSCYIPTGTGTWRISGYFLDQFGSTSNTPHITVGGPIELDTLMDTITAFPYAHKSIYDAWGVGKAGSISAKYDAIVTIDNDPISAVDQRVLYTNWFNDSNDISTVEKIMGYNLPIGGDEIVYEPIETGSENEVIEAWLAPNFAASVPISLSGYKTEINFVNVRPNNLVSAANILSGSWVGELDVFSTAVGDVEPVVLDLEYYWADYNPVSAAMAIEDGWWTYDLGAPNGYGHGINRGGSWYITIAVPGGEMIVNKTIDVVWSTPEIGTWSYAETTNAVLNDTLYSQISNSLELFAYYDGTTDPGDIIIGMYAGKVPLEAYVVRSMYSDAATHMNNTTLTTPITGYVNTINVNLIDSYDPGTRHNAYGAKYKILTTSSSNTNKAAIHQVEQVTTIDGLYTKVTKCVEGLYPTDLTMTSEKHTASIDLSATWSLPLSDNWFVAGYKLLNYPLSGQLPHSGSYYISSSDYNELDEFEIDYIGNTESYDVTWHTTIISPDHLCAKIVETSVVLDNDGRFEYTNTDITDPTMNSDVLSSVDVHPVWNPVAETFDYQLTCIDTYSDNLDLDGIQLFWYRYGSSNWSLFEPITRVLPDPTEQQIQYKFIYPGTYTVRVSAMVGETVVFVLSTAEDYIRILDIPPLVDFDLTNAIPSIDDYTAMQGSSSVEIAYYVSDVPAVQLTGYDVYLNTWTTAPGSFPLDIIWVDYGDGSVIERVTRTRGYSTEYGPDAFEYSLRDPRNSVLKHTYSIPDFGDYTYTVTVTAFSLNTGTYSIGYKTISNLGPAEPVKKYLLNNSMLEDGSVIYNVQMDQSSAMSMSSPADITPITYNDSRYYDILTR